MRIRIIYPDLCIMSEHSGWDDGNSDVGIWCADCFDGERISEWSTACKIPGFCSHLFKKQQDNVGRTENLYPCTAEAIVVRIPILKVKDYTLEELFEKQLWMLIPFYIFRYEKEFRKIDGNQKQLSGLRLEYEKIAGRPLDLRRISEKSKAVIMAWRPGTMGAEAIIFIFIEDSPVNKFQPKSFDFRLSRYTRAK